MRVIAPRTHARTPSNLRWLLHAAIGFVVLFYIAPLHLVLYRFTSITPMFGWLARVDTALHTNLTFIVVMLVLFALVYLAVIVLIKYLWAAGEQEEEARTLMVDLLSGAGVRLANNLILWGVPIICVALFLLRWGSLPLYVLGAVVWLGIVAGTLHPGKQKEAECAEDQEQLQEELHNTSEQIRRKEDDIAEKTFRWHFRERPEVGASSDRSFSFVLPISRKRYEQYASRPHEVTAESDYARFVLENLTHEVALTAGKIREVGLGREYCYFDEVCNTFAFARQFRYAYDIDTKEVEEYPRYPIETLWDEEGDCECHAILAAALLKDMGFDVVLLGVDFEKGPGHVAVGVAGADGIPGQFYEDSVTGAKYFYCEATPAEPTRERADWDWQIGEIPFRDVTRITKIDLTGIVITPPRQNDDAALDRSE